MKDRVPALGKANRVKITQDNGQIVEGVLSYADEAIEAGSAYCKANVLPDAVCDALGVNRVTAEPKDALTALRSYTNTTTEKVRKRFPTTFEKLVTGRFI